MQKLLNLNILVFLKVKGKSLLKSVNSKKSEMNPDSWGVSICSIDGQRCGFGDAGQMFTMQALSNPITYASVLSELGKRRNCTFFRFDRVLCTLEFPQLEVYHS